MTLSTPAAEHRGGNRERLGLNLAGSEFSHDRFKQGDNTRIKYHCYFLQLDRSWLFDVPSLIAARESLRAETDADARIMAESLYSQQRNHIHGFEL